MDDKDKPVVEIPVPDELDEESRKRFVENTADSILRHVEDQRVPHFGDFADLLATAKRHNLSASETRSLIDGVFPGLISKAGHEALFKGKVHLDGSGFFHVKH